MRVLPAVLMLLLPAILMLCAPSVAQQADASGLQGVLKTMDTAAASFRTAQADFVWEQYQKVVDETDTQEGTVYYRRSGKDIEMMASIKKPDRKFLLYKDAKLQIYQPKIEQVITRAAGANRGDIESFLVLGFGGSGQELTKAFDVTYVGPETVAGVATAKLQLVPKSEKMKNALPRILLWIDLERGISVQQQFFQQQGDYRLAKYSAIRVNEKLANDVFQLKTTSKTQFVTSGG